MIEHLGPPDGSHERRRRERIRLRTIDDLGGRTVWWATALPAGRAAAQQRSDSLRAAGEVAAERLEIALPEPLRALVEQLDGMLRGDGPAAPLGPEQEQAFAGATAVGDALLGDEVGSGDVVVLVDPAAAMLAEAMRERGARVVWHVAIRAQREMVMRALRFVERSAPAIDAYVTSWSTPLPRGREQHGVAAFMAGPDAVSASESTTASGGRGYDPELGWSRLLADVVRGGRDEHVGGTRHARPAVAVR
jgi:hypothetical protein